MSERVKQVQVVNAAEMPISSAPCRLSEAQVGEGKQSPYRLEFMIVGLPKSPNALLGAHWTIRSGHAKKWKRAVWRNCWHLKPPKPLERAHITFTRVSSGQMDDDNLALSFKSIRDGLKEAGIIADDSPQHVKCEYVPERCKRGQGHIKVRVIEIQDTQTKGAKE